MTRSEEINAKELREINKSLAVIAEAMKELTRTQKKPATSAAAKKTVEK